MKEKVIIAGDKKNLIGILCEAKKEGFGTQKPSVLLLNAGLVHRIGPFRMNVDLSRELSELGYDVLRVDISGIGDSDKIANDSRSYEQRNLDDIGEFVKYLSSNNPQGVVVIGLCTGADHSHKAAVAYKEVVGTILFDGYGYPTFKFYLKRYGPILLSFNRTINAIKKVFKALFRIGGKSSGDASGADAYFWKLPPKSNYINDLELLRERGVKQFYVYTSGVDGYYNYKEQFADGFGSKDYSRDITVEYYDRSDHTYSLHNDRMRMFKDVTNWLLTNFGGSQES